MSSRPAVALLNKQPSTVVYFTELESYLTTLQCEHYHRRIISETKQTMTSKQSSIFQGVYEGNFYVLLVKVSHQLSLWEELDATSLLNF